MTRVPVYPRPRFRIDKRPLFEGGPLRWILTDRRQGRRYALRTWAMALALIGEILTDERGA